jgi:membrane protease YdiL (CAAX protease family)
MSYLISSENPLVKLASIKGKKPHWAVALLLTLGFLILGQITGFLISMPIAPLIKSISNPAWKSALTIFNQLILGFLPVIFFVFLWMYFYEKRPFSHLGFQKKNSLKLYFNGFLRGAIMFCSVVGILALIHFVGWENGNPLLQGEGVFLPIIVLLFGFVVQGATEEILCRGWLMPILSARYNLWVGILVSSSLFGLLHAVNPGVTVFAVVNIVLVGIFFSLFALRQGSLWGVCALHSIWNWLQGNFFGFEVSGQDGGPTLLNLKEIGPDWITGGTFGPEGGVTSTFIICVGIAIILYKNNSDKKTIQAQTL